MSVASVLLPVFVEVMLVYALLGALIVSRQVATRRQRLAPHDIAEGQAAWDGRSRQIAASYSNQFELPVLFFALIALALATHRTDALLVVLEWAFVLARLAHAAIHVTTNTLRLRGLAFAASAAALGTAWLAFAAGILAG